MDESQRGAVRLFTEAKSLVDIGYWQMPDANAAERAASERTQRTIWALGSVTNAREGLDGDMAKAVDAVTLDLARSLAADMHDAMAARRLNPNAVRDKDLLAYPVDGPTLASDAPRATPQQISLGVRIGQAIEDATSRGGAWSFGMSPEAGRRRGEARMAAVSIDHLIQRGVGDRRLQGAYEQAAMAVGADLSRRTRAAIGDGLDVDRLRPASVYTAMFEQGLLGERTASSPARGPEISLEAPMQMPRMAGAGR